MRVVAARFSEPSQASAARDLLEREVDHAGLEVAPLAHPGEEVSGDALLAGRFPDEQVSAAVELVERAGGEIVANIDERWTGLSSSRSEPQSPPARGARSTPVTQSHKSAYLH